MNARKIYYVQGMISLLAIPLLLYHFTHRHIQSPKKYGISIFWPKETAFKKNPGMFGELPPKRMYIDIFLTGNNVKNKKEFNLAQSKIRSIFSNKDTLTGVHFIFGDSADYWTFVKAIDICRMEGVESYIPYKNHLWVLYSPRRTVDTTKRIQTIKL